MGELLARLGGTTAIWLVAALVAIVIEVGTPSFGFVLVAAAAVAAAVVAGSGFGLIAQLLTFGVSALFLLTFLRPRILAKLAPSPGVPDRAAGLVGRRGRVTEAIDPVSGRGRVLVEGQDWAAACAHALSEGTEIVVTGTSGIKLIVAAKAS